MDPPNNDASQVRLLGQAVAPLSAVGAAVLARHGFLHLDPSCWSEIVLPCRRFAGRWSQRVTLTSVLNTVAGVFEWFLFNNAVRRVKLKEPPLFVLGHWRSGTTLLHELLMLDERHTCPTTYQCFAPHHFLWTVVVLSCFRPAILLPKKRPMDDMAAGWDRPQEDEFALVNLGVPSPYLAWAFPNHGPVYDEYLDLRTLPVAERESWKNKWRGFVRRIALANDRRIVLKSPTHTARVRTILEVFPDAKFIHIVRDPLALFPSTVRLWKSLSEVQGFQIPRDAAAGSNRAYSTTLCGCTSASSRIASSFRRAGWSIFATKN